MIVPSGLPAGSLQIVQDTGSGGSWPVSSDRTAWALGAEAVLNTLQGSAQRRFAAEAYRALRGSVEADRAAIFDASDGLYTGEQSFLDWREQTYAPYVVKDLTQLAQSKALSTNALQYRALRLVSGLARDRGDAAIAARYGRWAEALKIAINRYFWLAEYDLYASLLTADAPAIPVAKFDLLGEALAVTSGIADLARARAIVAHYPHAPFGPPVYYPEQPEVAIYHNRANWPFATAFDLEAAAQVGNVAVADNAFDSLIRAAALHLTNTENLEWLTGRSQYDDGPVINSPRQLWSVAGYIDMVAKVIFGYHVEKRGFRIRPFLTAHMRAVLGGDTATLANLSYKDRGLTIELHLPPAEGAGYYPPAQVTLNGRPVTGLITASQLKPQNKIVVSFGPGRAGDDRIRWVAPVAPNSRDDPRVFAPQVPSIDVSRDRPERDCIHPGGHLRPASVALRDLARRRSQGARFECRQLAGPGAADAGSASLLSRGGKLLRQRQCLASLRGELHQRCRSKDDQLAGGHGTYRKRRRQQLHCHVEVQSGERGHVRAVIDLRQSRLRHQHGCHECREAH